MDIEAVQNCPHGDIGEPPGEGARRFIRQRQQQHVFCSDPARGKKRDAFTYLVRLSSTWTCDQDCAGVWRRLDDLLNSWQAVLP